MNDLPVPVIQQEKIRIALPSSAILTDWAVLEESMRAAVKEAKKARDEIQRTSREHHDVIYRYTNELSNLRNKVSDLEYEIRKRKYGVEDLQSRTTRWESRLDNALFREKERKEAEKVEKKKKFWQKLFKK